MVRQCDRPELAINQGSTTSLVRDAYENALAPALIAGQIEGDGPQGVDAVSNAPGVPRQSPQAILVDGIADDGVPQRVTRDLEVDLRNPGGEGGD